jgi:hypothetical protein
VAQMLREGRAGTPFGDAVDPVIARTWGLLDQVGDGLRDQGIRNEQQFAAAMTPPAAPEAASASLVGEIRAMLAPYLDAIRAGTDDPAMRGMATAALRGVTGWPEARAAGMVEQVIAAIRQAPDALDGLDDMLARAMDGDGPMFAMGGDDGKPKKAKSKAAEIKAIEDELEDLRKFADLSEGELRGIANDVATKIVGSPAGKVINPFRDDPLGLLNKGPRQVSGPLQKRTLTMPDEMIEDFLDSDSERIARFYARSMAPDIATVREFGDLELSETKRKIQEEANLLKSRALVNAGLTEEAFANLVQTAEAARTLRRSGRSGEVTPEMAEAIKKVESIEGQNKAIQEVAERDMKDLQAMSDRLRHNYKLPDDPTATIPKLARRAKQINVFRLMGGVVLSSVTDLARPIMTQGIGATLDGTVKALSNLKAARGLREEVKLAGTALDMVLDTRAHGIADIMDDFGGYSRFDRALNAVQANYGLTSLMSPWNAALKQWAGVIVQTRILQEARDLAGGATFGRNRLLRVAQSGLDPELMQRIWTQFQQHGEIDGKVMLPNTEKWTDRPARDAYRAAIVHEVDRTIITPGQEKPLWLSTQLGSVMGQFKSFGVVSVQRTMIAGLQQRDAGVVAGALLSVGLGVMVEYLKTIAHGKELPKTREQLIYAGFGNSGLAGWLYDADHLMYRASRGNIGLQNLVGAKAPISRYRSQSVVDALAGPTFGAAGDVLQAFGAAASGDVRQSDLRALRRLLPYQNLFYLSRGIRALEDNIIEQFNLPKTKPRAFQALE